MKETLHAESTYYEAQQVFLLIFITLCYDRLRNTGTDSQTELNF